MTDRVAARHVLRKAIRDIDIGESESAIERAKEGIEILEGDGG